MLYEILIVVYLIISICLIGLVLIQQGKGADMGASFGAGSSATIFGSSGSGNFLTKSTTWLAIAFFAISLLLGNLTANRVKSTDEWNNLSVAQKAATKNQKTAPAKNTSINSAELTKTSTSANKDVPAGNDKPNSDVPK